MQISFHNYYTNEELKQILLGLKEFHKQDFAFVGNISQVLKSKKNIWFMGVLINFNRNRLRDNSWQKGEVLYLRELRGNAEKEAAYFVPVSSVNEFAKNEDSIWLELKNLMLKEVEVKQLLL